MILEEASVGNFGYVLWTPLDFFLHLLGGGRKTVYLIIYRTAVYKKETQGMRCITVILV